MLFVWGMIVVLILLITILPRRLSLKEVIILFPIIGYFAWTAHIVVGIMLDFVDFGPTKKVEFTDWALVTFIPSLMGILFLNFKMNRLIFYIVVWTVISFSIELFLDVIGYMKHTEWSILYSIPTYLLAFYLLHRFYESVIKTLNCPSPN
ncbi:hypothetical protein AB5I83_18080 [Mesobacillus sp. LC4]